MSALSKRDQTLELLDLSLWEIYADWLDGHLDDYDETAIELFDDGSLNIATYSDYTGDLGHPGWMDFEQATLGMASFEDNPIYRRWAEWPMSDWAIARYLDSQPTVRLNTLMDWTIQ